MTGVAEQRAGEPANPAARRQPVSVVIVTRNESARIGACLDSAPGRMRSSCSTAEARTEPKISAAPAGPLLRRVPGGAIQRRKTWRWKKRAIPGCSAWTPTRSSPMGSGSEFWNSSPPTALRTATAFRGKIFFRKVAALWRSLAGSSDPPFSQGPRAVQRKGGPRVGGSKRRGGRDRQSARAPQLQ